MDTATIDTTTTDLQADPDKGRDGRPVDQKIQRLSTASLKRVLEPDTEVPGHVRDGQILPDELISLATVPELFDALTPEQKATLSREEFASITDTGIRFESILMAGFGFDIASRDDLTDPRVTYLLHELGEETRHSRLFVRLLQQVKPQAKNPIDNAFTRVGQHFLMPLLDAMPSLFTLLVLSGEEIPDLLQKLAAEHPDTDPMIKAVSKYHRQEEARHLAFARIIFPEQWAKAGPIERFFVRYVGSRIVVALFDTIVHPGVYATVGLPTWDTWRKVNRSTERTALRHRALRPLLTTLVDVGAFVGGRIPKGWQRACGVDRRGNDRAPVEAA